MRFTDAELRAIADGLISFFDCTPGTPAGDALGKVRKEQDDRAEFVRGFNGD